MSNSQKFFDVCIHPTRRGDELSRDFPGHAQFCGRLLDLVNKKLRKDILELIYDDVVISHVVRTSLICLTFQHKSNIIYYYLIYIFTDR